MANSLGWDGDGWLDFADWLKREFDLEIPDDECRAIMTVGDLYDAIMLHLPVTSNNRKCASAMAFLRLRRALSDLRYPQQMAPSLPLTAVDPVRLQFALRGLEGGFHVPCAHPGRFSQWLGAILCFSLYGFLVSGVVALSFPQDCPAWVSLGLLCITAGGIIRNSRIPARPPEDCATLGDLAKRIAAYNYGRLVRLGARLSEDEMWDAVCEALAVHSEIPNTEITRETVFFDKQLKTAEAA